MTEETWSARLRALGTCLASDALDLLGVQGAVAGIRPAYPSAPTIAGSVVTVMLGPRRPDDPVGPHLATEAIELAEAGDVLVVGNSGRTEMSSWGGMLTTAAALRGLGGVVVDGACRDIEEAEEQRFGVFARAVTPVSAKGRIRQVATNVPITVGVVRVHPGDFVLADANGVVFISEQALGDLWTTARRLEDAEARALEALRRGGSASSAIDDRKLFGLEDQ